MCFRPNTLPDGQEVACRECKQCKRQFINDWAGRIIAETKTTPVTYYVTLTYGRDEHGNEDHLRAAILTYSDVQKYLKKIRYSYGKFRYFVVGEYGKKRGRAHWHLILYAQNEIPGIVLNDKFYQDKKWTHGTSLWKKFQTHHAYYCGKYVFKDYKDDLQVSKHEMSKIPPLGDAYFKKLARKYVDNGLAPQDNFYRFREIRERNGKERKFRLRLTSLENYCASYVAQWRKAYPWKETPKSELIDEYLDKLAGIELEKFERQIENLAIDEARQNAERMEQKYGKAIFQKNTHYIYDEGKRTPVTFDGTIYRRYPGDPKKVDPRKVKNKPPEPDTAIPLP